MSLFTGKTLIAAGIGGLLAMSLSAHAGVVLSSSRVIYGQTLHEKTIKATNRGSCPVLIETWIDDGRENQAPDKLNLPFMVTPPVGRLDPGREQTIKITALNTTFPQDRESVYWLSVLEIPAKSKASANANTLQVALRTRIKLFWRPDHLAGSATEAAEHLQWQWSSENGKPALIANNTSPYYVSLSKAEVKSGAMQWTVTPKMIPPFGKETLAVNSLKATPGSAEIHYIAIGDLGNILDNNQKIK